MKNAIVYLIYKYCAILLSLSYSLAVKDVIFLFVMNESYVGKLGLLGTEENWRRDQKGDVQLTAFLFGVKWNRSVGFRVQ